MDEGGVFGFLRPEYAFLTCGIDFKGLHNILTLLFYRGIDSISRAVRLRRMDPIV